MLHLQAPMSAQPIKMLFGAIAFLCLSTVQAKASAGTELAITARSGVGLFKSATSKKRIKGGTKAIPNTKKNPAWRVTHLGKTSRSRVLVKACKGRNCVRGWVSKKYTRPKVNKQRRSRDSQTEAKVPVCTECLAGFSKLEKDIAAIVDSSPAKLTDKVTRHAKRNPRHPKGWPISKHGFSFPISINDSYITSRFGVRLLHGYPDYHEGLDIGTFHKSVKFHAMKGGKVKSVVMKCKHYNGELCNRRRGNQIQIEHDDGSVMHYSHLNRRCSVLVHKGQRVKIGEPIGCVGDSGAGPIHLDVRLLKANGKNHKTIKRRITIKGKSKMENIRIDYLPVHRMLGKLYYMYKSRRELLAAKSSKLLAAKKRKKRKKRKSKS